MWIVCLCYVAQACANVCEFVCETTTTTTIPGEKRGKSGQNGRATMILCNEYMHFLLAFCALVSLTLGKILTTFVLFLLVVPRSRVNVWTRTCVYVLVCVRDVGVGVSGAGRVWVANVCEVKLRSGLVVCLLHNFSNFFLLFSFSFSLLCSSFCVIRYYSSCLIFHRSLSSFFSSLASLTNFFADFFYLFLY